MCKFFKQPTALVEAAVTNGASRTPQAWARSTSCSANSGLEAKITASGTCAPGHSSRSSAQTSGRERRAEWPVQRLACAGLIDDVLGADHDLAVALLAQRSRVLMLHSHRSVLLFGQARIIQSVPPNWASCRVETTVQTAPNTSPILARDPELPLAG